MDGPPSIPPARLAPVWESAQPSLRRHPAICGCLGRARAHRVARPKSSETLSRTAMSSCSRRSPAHRPNGQGFSCAAVEPRACARRTGSLLDRPAASRPPTRIRHPRGPDLHSGQACGARALTHDPLVFVRRCGEPPNRWRKTNGALPQPDESCRGGLGCGGSGRRD
jgi:hypothetical protein